MEEDTTVESMVKKCGYSSARWGGGIRSPGCAGCPFAETIPPKNPLVIRTPTDINTGTTLAMMKRAVTQAEVNGGGWVVLVFHSVCNACDKLSISPDQLTAFLDWLQPRASTGTVVKTHGEVIGDGPACMRLISIVPSCPAVRVGLRGRRVRRGTDSELPGCLGCASPRPLISTWLAI